MKVLPHIYYCLQGKGPISSDAGMLHPKWKEKKNVMEEMLKKATKVHVYVQCFSFFFQA